MKFLYLSKRRLLVIWLISGIIILLAASAGQKEQDMKAVFSSPVSSRVIVIDPGHGGFDSGAVSPSGAREDELNLKVAMKLRQYLSEHRAVVILTRETDEALGSRKSEDMKKDSDYQESNRMSLSAYI